MKLSASKFGLTLFVTTVILIATVLLTWFFEWCGLTVQDQVRTVQSMKEFVGCGKKGQVRRAKLG